MYFDRLTSISRNLTVGEITTALTITIESSNNFGRVSQTVPSRLDYISIFNDQKQLRSITRRDCRGNSAFKQ